LNTLRSLKPGKTFVLNIGNNLYPLSNVAAQVAESAGAKSEKLTDHLIFRADLESDDALEGAEEFLAITKAC